MSIIDRILNNKHLEMLSNRKKKCCSNCKYSREQREGEVPVHFKGYLICTEGTIKDIPVEKTSKCNFHLWKI